MRLGASLDQGERTVAAMPATVFAPHRGARPRCGVVLHHSDEAWCPVISITTVLQLQQSAARFARPASMARSSPVRGEET